jgi:hypothetical protein
VGHLQGQGGHQSSFALVGAALFKGVVKGVHGGFPCGLHAAQVERRTQGWVRRWGLVATSQANQRLRRL